MVFAPVFVLSSIGSVQAVPTRFQTSLDTNARIPGVQYRQILQMLPVPTCDVLLIGPGHNTTLLFRRANRPVQREWYSLGGRVLNNETLRSCAARKLLEELGIKRPTTRMIYGGTMEEFFADSAFEGISSHCINNVFGYVLTNTEEKNFVEGSRSLRAALDKQHFEARWFALDDASLHPYVATKNALLRSALARQAALQATGSACADLGRFV